MRLVLLTLYMALVLGANAATADTAMLESLREGDMKKLNFHATPSLVPDTPFQNADGTGNLSLADFRGQFLLVNVWAAWCAPCRKEMPTLAALQSELGGERFQVVTIATGRNSASGIEKFFMSNNITNLPSNRDPKQSLARDMQVLGLPVTVIIDPEGREIARLIGDADWNSKSAKNIISQLMKLM